MSDPPDLDLDARAAAFEPELRVLLDARDAQLKRVSAGTVLIRKGELADALYLLLEGRLKVSVDGREGAHVRAEMSSPNVVGEGQLLGSGRRVATVTALEPSVLLEIPRASVDRLLGEHPELLHRLVGIARERLHVSAMQDFFRAKIGVADEGVVQDLIDRAERLTMERGDILLEGGASGDGVYLLLEGKLSFGEPEESTLSSLLPGESVGEVELLSDRVRTATVWADRHSVVARWPHAELERAMREAPDLTRGFARVAVEKDGPLVEASPGRGVVNVAVEGVDVDLRHFESQLVEALAQLTPGARVVRSRDAEAHATRGRNLDAFRVGAWRSELEAQYSFLLWRIDPSWKAWTEHCLEGADIVLTVANPQAAAPKVSPPKSRHVRSWLALAHGGRGQGVWGGVPRDRVFHIDPRDPRDFGRLARAVAGREVGLVLSGGGARGFAHIGTLRALEEFGLPIDVLGGTSAGAVVGVLYSLGMGVDDIRRHFSEILGGAVDYTLPLLAVARGRWLAQRIEAVCGGLNFDDVRLPCFAVAADISSASQLVLEHGPIVPALRATTCVPGIFPPVLVEGRWAVDGAVLNGLPLDVMRLRVGTRGRVLGSELSAEREVQPQSTAVEPARMQGGWHLLLDWLRGRLDRPTLFEAFDRAGAAATNHHLRSKMERARPEILVRHDVSHHSPIVFSRGTQALEERGYERAKQVLEANTNGGVGPKGPALR